MCGAASGCPRVSVWAGTENNQKWGGGLTFYQDPENKWLKAVHEV